MNLKFTHLFKQPSNRSVKAQAPRRDTLRYVFRLLKRFLTGQRRVFALALLFLLAEAVTSIAEAYPLSYLIDFLRGDRADLFTLLGLPAVMSPQLATLAAVTIAIVVMAMINSLGDSLAEIYFAQGGRMLGYNLRLTLYRHLQRLSLAFHDQRRTGDILTRLTGDVSEVENFVTGSLSDIVGSVMVLIGTMVVLVYRSWQVSLLALVIVPLMVLVSNYFSQRIKVATKQQRAREGDLASATQEMLTSIRVIQTYSQGDHELKRFAEHNQKNVAAALAAALQQARFSWVVKVLEALAISGVVWLGLWLINQTAITVGTLLFFIASIQNIFKPTRKIIKEWNTIGKIYASVERIGELLDRKPAVSDAPDAIPAPPFQGHIEFQSVHFAYQPITDESDSKQVAQAELRQVLKGVTFGAAPGEVLALVGHTGAGKSTIIQLLPRLYDPGAGRIRIDGVDIRGYTLESLRSQIGVVLQETVLFNGTVADNIAYGRVNATREEVIRAAMQANAHGFIEKMADGYDTMLGERGSNLSGGQRQRIAIARAFIRNAPILILDEPTTGLDPESSELVLLALRMLMRGKTTVIISHDFKLVRQANRIVVLNEGRIEQMGSHRELLDQQGTYATLYIKQFGHAKADEEQWEGVLNDLLHSPAFHHQWPTVRTAFDADAMRAHLQNALLGPVTEIGGEIVGENYTIMQCKPGKASYLDEEGCLLRYELQLKHPLHEETQSALVLARIFASSAEAEDYLRHRLASLAVKMSGRPEIAPFAQPVALLETLNMAVSVFPIDGELPALIGATDQQQMTQFLRESLTTVGDKGSDQRFTVENCTIEAGHYGRQHRCVLRYVVEGTRTDADGKHGEGDTALATQVVYGKVAADDRCKVVGTVLSALHWHLPSVRSRRRFILPRIVGYRPKLRLLLLEGIPGTPRIPQLIQAYLAGTAAAKAGGLTLEQAMQDCAQVAAALHKTDIKLDMPRTFADEVAYLQGYMPAVQKFSLALAMQLQDALMRLQRYTVATQPMPLALSHGDYTYTQLLFADDSCGLVDFDTICQAEPALDLGQFLAYLRLAAYKIQQRNAAQETQHPAPPLTIDELCTQFITTYGRAAGYHGQQMVQLQERVAAYEIISLMRITLHSWQKMKGDRLQLVLDLLEERITCLTKATLTVSHHAAPAEQSLRQAKPATHLRKPTPFWQSNAVSQPGLPQP